MDDYYNEKGILNDSRFDINWDIKKIANYGQKVIFYTFMITKE